MLKELYTAAAGMVPQQTRLEVIANNIANASTPGFKKESVFERNLIDSTANFFNVPGEIEQNDPPIGSYTDFSSGAMQKTDNPLDLAVDNVNEFFVLQDENENQYLSKAGHFKLNPDGTIQAMDGKILMGVEGPITLKKEFNRNPVELDDTKEINLKINKNGEVFVNGSAMGAIQIVNVENPESLDRVSNNCFVATKDTIARQTKQDDVSVQQGWIENSNVSVVKEMVAMIELQRTFEAGSKVIQANNETLDKDTQLGRYY